MTYKIVGVDSSFRTICGSILTPIMTLEDECGGRSQIVMDDRCYVLYNRRFGTERYAMVCHWYREAAEALSLHLRTKDHFVLGLVETAKIKRNMA